MFYKITVASLLFLLTVMVHTNARVMTSTDSMWSIHTAKSLLTDGDIILEEYRAEIEAKGKYGVRLRKGDYYNYFPLGSSILALPFVYGYEHFPSIAKFLVPQLWEIQDRLGFYPPVERVSLLLERLIACFYVGLATSILFLLLCKVTGRVTAFSLAFIFSFASPTLSVASRGLWQHGPNMFILLIGMACLMSNRWWIRACSALPFSFGYIVRPTSGIAFTLGAIVVGWFGRKTVLLYLVLMSCVLIPFILWNEQFFGAVIPPYYKASRLTFGPTTINAMLANLFSFSRGLFIFCPYLLTGLLVPFLVMLKHTTLFPRLKDVPPYIIFSAGYIVLHWIAVSAFPNWWGGHTFGPRYMSDTVPLCVILIAWLHERLPERWFKQFNIVLILVLSCVMIKVHWYGANEQSAWNWNINPHNIDDDPSRVWNFRGSQFLRGLLR